MRTSDTGCQASHMNLLRCVVVDDDLPFIQAAQVLLAADGVMVAGKASSVAEAVRQVAALRPDVVLVDIRLGSESGFDAVRQLSAGGLAAPAIMISTHSEGDYADLLADSPALGFLAKARLSGAAIREILGQN